MRKAIAEASACRSYAPFVADFEWRVNVQRVPWAQIHWLTDVCLRTLAQYEEGTLGQNVPESRTAEQVEAAVDSAMAPLHAALSELRSTVDANIAMLRRRGAIPIDGPPTGMAGCH